MYQDCDILGNMYALPFDCCKILDLLLRVCYFKKKNVNVLV